MCILSYSEHHKSASSVELLSDCEMWLWTLVVMFFICYLSSWLYSCFVYSHVKLSDEYMRYRKFSKISCKLSSTFTSSFLSVVLKTFFTFHKANFKVLNYFTSNIIVDLIFEFKNSMSLYFKAYMLLIFNIPSHKFRFNDKFVQVVLVWEHTYIVVFSWLNSVIFCKHILLQFLFAFYLIFNIWNQYTVSRPSEAEFYYRTWDFYL